MIDPKQLRQYVIDPVLRDLDLYSPEASDLILGTICQESQCGKYLHQLGGGPALGICQMEPTTHDDLWANFIKGRYGLGGTIYAAAGMDAHEANDLVYNLRYAVAMCRVHYLRKPGAIPTDLPGQAAYWKKNYNTPLGKGKIEEYIKNWEKFSS